VSNDCWPDMENDPDAQRRIKKACELLDAKDGMTVLDIGCHKQEAARYLPEKALYCGVDYELIHPNTIKMDIDGGFKFPKVVDRILCLEVLEHLTVPWGALQSISLTLSDTGIAVISLPNEATLFHRLRCLFGIVDQECFSGAGKHLHLPSLAQSRKFLSEFFVIENEAYYICKEARGVRQSWPKMLLRIVPRYLFQFLAETLPSLFARGFIFKCVHRPK